MGDAADEAPASSRITGVPLLVVMICCDVRLFFWEYGVVTGELLLFVQRGVIQLGRTRFVAEFTFDLFPKSLDDAFVM